MAHDPYSGDIPRPYRNEIPPDNFQPRFEPLPMDREYSGVSVWIPILLLIALFVSAIYFFSGDRTATTSTMRADQGAVTTSEPSSN